MAGAQPEAVSATEAAARADRYTGQSGRRVEDHRILTGRARYVHDHTPEGALHMALVRSQHAHARIAAIDTSAAAARPECALVLTAADIVEEFNPMPCGLEGFEEWSLARGVVRERLRSVEGREVGR